MFFAGVVGDYLGGVVSDRILHRTGDLQKARRNVVMLGFLGSFVCLLPVFLTHDLVSIIVALGAAFFFAELVIGPMWSIPMDIAGKFSGTAAGMMNTGSALAAILSPIAFGFIIDETGNWQLPFAGSLGVSAARGRSGADDASGAGVRRSKGTPSSSYLVMWAFGHLIWSVGNVAAIARSSHCDPRGRCGGGSALRGSFSSRIAAL